MTYNVMLDVVDPHSIVVDIGIVGLAALDVVDPHGITVDVAEVWNATD